MVYVAVCRQYLSGRILSVVCNHIVSKPLPLKYCPTLQPPDSSLSSVLFTQNTQPLSEIIKQQDCDYNQCVDEDLTYLTP